MRNCGWLVIMVAAVAVAGGCKKQKNSKPSAAPVSPLATVESEDAALPATSSATSKPASAPASQPALPPASTYDSKPPYPVRLFVIDEDADQPGWLRIETRQDVTTVGEATGVFPSQNRMEVRTQNVSRLRIHIDHLPLNPRKRIFLRIDEQGIELARKDREYVYMERRSTGAWSVVAPPGE